MRAWGLPAYAQDRTHEEIDQALGLEMLGREVASFSAIICPDGCFPRLLAQVTARGYLPKTMTPIPARVDFDIGDTNYEIQMTLYYLAPAPSGNHSHATATDRVYVSD